MENSTVAIILAGGKSDRMGVAKGLLKFGKTFWILEQIDRLGKSGLKYVYIGLGHDYEHYFLGIDWFELATKKCIRFMGVRVRVVVNATPELGAFSTLQTVLKNINSTSDILINPIDIPALKKEALSKILNHHNSVVIPTFNKKSGHPIKLEPNFWHSLLKLDPNLETSRLDFLIKELHPQKISHISINEDSILKNLNTPSEWKQFLNKE